MRTNDASDGFTVIEVVVALVIFSIVAVTLVSITEYVQYSQRQSQYTSIANRAAQAKISEYQSNGYEAINVDVPDDFSDESIVDGLPAGSTAMVEASQSSISAHSKEVEVTITYPAADTIKTVKLKAYVSEGGNI